MKAQIVASFDAITLSEFKYALQKLNDVEQECPSRIKVFLLVIAEELSTEQVAEIFGGIKPPFKYIKRITRSSSLASNQDINKEKHKQTN